jgi:desulfoferrodoxin (superoxide reductase-like protein)
MDSDKGKPVPVILNNKIKDTGPIEVEVRRGQVEHKVVREEQISFDKIVEDSDSKFIMTGKMTKIGMGNFLQLIEKHEIGEVNGFFEEEVVVSSEMITQIATASVVDEDDEDMKYIESMAIGVLTGGLFLSIFILAIKTTEDLRSYAWIILLVSLGLLGYYTWKGLKSGELKRIIRVCVKSLSKK